MPPCRQAVTVDPLAPTLSWGASTPGTEGATIALGTLAATVNSLSGDSNTLTSPVVSAIPVGATLSDGHGHSFTATAGTTSVNVSGWTLSSLTVTPTNDTDFTLTATATTGDANGHTSTANITEAVTVDPLAPTLSWAPSSVSINHAHDAKAYALGAIRYTINELSGDNNSLQSLTISGIPVGDTLKAGTHTFTASTGDTSVNVSTWNLNKLTLNAHGHAGTFTLTATAIESDAQGNLVTSTTATESVVVMPAGVVGSPINLALAEPSGAQDANSSVLVSALPVGATLSDGTHSFTTGRPYVGRRSHLEPSPTDNHATGFRGGDAQCDRDIGAQRRHDHYPANR